MRGLLEAEVGDHPQVGFVGGKGLRFKIELVRDRGTKEPLLDPALLKRYKQVYMEHGLVGSVVGGEVASVGVSAGISPPLTIEREDLVFAVGVIKAALDAVTAEIK